MNANALQTTLNNKEVYELLRQSKSKCPEIKEIVLREVSPEPDKKIDTVVLKCTAHSYVLIPKDGGLICASGFRLLTGIATGLFVCSVAFLVIYLWMNDFRFYSWIPLIAVAITTLIVGAVLLFGRSERNKVMSFVQAKLKS